MIIARPVAGIVACAIFPTQIFAAPAEQAQCIYETVPKERLSDFGESAFAPEDKQKPDLDPIYNAAENACIGQYGWSETEAENSRQVFFARVSREFLGSIFIENGLDPKKIDRAYSGVKGQILPKADPLQKNEQILVAALQKQSFPVDNKEVLDFAFTYVGLQIGEDESLADFISGRKGSK